MIYKREKKKKDFETFLELCHVLIHQRKYNFDIKKKGF